MIGLLLIVEGFTTRNAPDGWSGGICNVDCRSPLSRMEKFVDGTVLICHDEKLVMQKPRLGHLDDVQSVFRNMKKARRSGL